MSEGSIRERRSLRVCYVAVDVEVPSSKGSSTHVTEVARGLQDLGASVVVLSRRMGSWQASSEKFQGFMVYRVYRGIFSPLSAKEGGRYTGSERTGFFPKLYRNYLSTVLALYCGVVAARLVKNHNLDVVIERETSYGAGAIASILTGRALVLEVNGPNFSPLSSRRARAITAYSQSMVGEKFKGKTRIIDAGVNTELFRPNQSAGSSIRERYDLGRSPVVGYVGSFQAWHGVADLVRSSRSVLKKIPETKFLMVGPGSGGTRLLAEEMGVANSFVFVGPVPYDNVPDYVNASDILVSPTNPALSGWTKFHGPPEQFKIFEYMACRKPIIITSVGPMLRIVKHGVNGITVPPGDHAALSKAICNLIRNPDFAVRLASRAYAIVAKNYTWANHTKEIHRVAGEATGIPSFDLSPTWGT